MFKLSKPFLDSRPVYISSSETAGLIIAEAALLLEIPKPGEKKV